MGEYGGVKDRDGVFNERKEGGGGGGERGGIGGRVSTELMGVCGPGAGPRITSPSCSWRKDPRRGP